MVVRILILSIATVCLVAGCGPHEPTDAEAQELRKQWSNEAYEDAMKKMGKEKELEEGKKRDEAYERGENVSGR